MEVMVRVKLLAGDFAFLCVFAPLREPPFVLLSTSVLNNRGFTQRRKDAKYLFRRIRLKV